MAKWRFDSILSQSSDVKSPSPVGPACSHGTRVTSTGLGWEVRLCPRPQRSGLHHGRGVGTTEEIPAVETGSHTVSQDLKWSFNSDTCKTWRSFFPFQLFICLNNTPCACVSVSVCVAVAADSDVVLIWFSAKCLAEYDSAWPRSSQQSCNAGCGCKCCNYW